jgi:hypothetical protein
MVAVHETPSFAFRRRSLFLLPDDDQDDGHEDDGDVRESAP